MLQWLDELELVNQRIKALRADVPKDVDFGQQVELMADITTIVARIDKILEEHGR